MTLHDETPPDAGDANDPLNMEIRRRDAYRLVFGAAAAAMLPAPAEARERPQFLHGVASGDPGRRSVVIWTRITPAYPALPLIVRWAVARNPDMSSVVAGGVFLTSAARDFTVKGEVGNLQPGAIYYYQFATLDGRVRSPIGKTRTLPNEYSADPFSLLVFSCSNFEKGYFNVYAEAAKEEGVFAALHLGDYLYEYGPRGYMTPALAAGLVNEPRADRLAPTAELVTLDAYRTRHALYKSDANLQALHAALPWIVVYDDHESANDGWVGGAENHQPAEGDWSARRRAALQAYYEWMPLRDPVRRICLNPRRESPTAHYRAFDFGKVARLVMLDTRLAGRDEQLDGPALIGAYTNPATDVVDGRARTLMGATQEAWVDQQLSGSAQIWQIIGNQTLCYYQNTPDYTNFPAFDAAQKSAISQAIDALFGPGAGAQYAALGAAGAPNPAASDSWTGYPTARARFNATLAKARNPVLLSGDSHNAWTANLRGNVGTGVQPLAVEFGGASVSSPGLEQTFPSLPSPAVSALYTFSSASKSPTDKLIWADAANRGYMRVDISEAKLTTTYVTVSTVFETGCAATRAKSFDVLPGQKQTTV